MGYVVEEGPEEVVLSHIGVEAAYELPHLTRIVEGTGGCGEEPVSTTGTLPRRDRHSGSVHRGTAHSAWRRRRDSVAAMRAACAFA